MPKIEFGLTSAGKLETILRQHQGQIVEFAELEVIFGSTAAYYTAAKNLRQAGYSFETIANRGYRLPNPNEPKVS